MRRLLPLLLLTLAACGDSQDESAEHQARCAGIPVVDEASAKAKDEADRKRIRDAEQAKIGAAPAPAPAPAPAGTPAQAPAQTQAGTPAQAKGGDEQNKATVREFIRKLMDVPRVVPATAAKPSETRGGPGSFAKLSAAQVDEFVAAIIYGSARYMPKSLKDDEKWALVCAEISIESAFRPDVASPNPANNSLMSVNPLQLTLGIWDDIFRKYAPGEGLVHYDGSPWDPKQTQNSALEHSIWDGVVASLWCITEQGRRGCPEWFGGPDGPCPKNMHTAFLSWVIGGPALKSGGDLAGQRDAYIASIETDLKVLGYPVSLVNTGF